MNAPNSNSLRRWIFGIALLWLHVYCLAARESIGNYEQRHTDRRLKGGKKSSKGDAGGGNDGLGLDGGQAADNQAFQSNSQGFSVNSGNCRCEYPHEGLFQNGRQLRVRQSSAAAASSVEVGGFTVYPDDYFACRGVVFVCEGDFFYGPLWNYDCVSTGSGDPYRGSVAMVPSDYPLCACPAVMPSDTSTNNGRNQNPLAGSKRHFHFGSHNNHNGYNFNVFNVQPGKKGKHARRRAASVAEEPHSIMKNPRMEFVFEARAGRKGKGKSAAKGKAKGGKGKGGGKSTKGKKGKSNKNGITSYNPTFKPFRCPPTRAPVRITRHPTISPRTPAPSATTNAPTNPPSISFIPTTMPLATDTPSKFPSDSPTAHQVSPSPSVSSQPTQFPVTPVPSGIGPGSTAPTPFVTTSFPTMTFVPSTAPSNFTKRPKPVRPTRAPKKRTKAPTRAPKNRTKAPTRAPKNRTKAPTRAPNRTKAPSSLAPVVNNRTSLPTTTNPTATPTLSVAPSPTSTPTINNSTGAPTSTFAPTSPNSTITPSTIAPSRPNITFAPNTTNATLAPSSANTTIAPSTLAPQISPAPTPTASTRTPSDSPSLIPSVVPSKVVADQQVTDTPTVPIEVLTPSPTSQVVAITLKPTIAPTTLTPLHSQEPSLLPFCPEPTSSSSDSASSDEEGSDTPTLNPSTNGQLTSSEVVGVTCRLRPPTSAPTIYATLDSSDMNEVIPCIAIIDTVETTAESLNLTWSTFRSKYPSRSFCLLQPLPNEKSELKIPELFDVDSKAIYSSVSRDYGAGALASSWFGLCRLGTLRSQGINKVAVYIDDWDRVTARHLRASYEFFLLDITAQGISLLRTYENSDDNWVIPFQRDFH